jgi:hypothetical protein
LFDVGQSDWERAAAISGRLPVKFSSTIHGDAEKKKRPTWALLFLPFFSGGDV